jgi:hypothetical protein
MTDDLVKRLRDFEQWMRDPEEQKFTLSSDLFDEAASRIEELEAALNRIAMEDAKLDEPALWLDDDMPLGLFIAMTLGEKKDD